MMRIEGLVVGALGQTILIGPRVPAGMVWEIDAAGIGTSVNITWAVDYSLNKAHATFGDGSDWYIPLPVSPLNSHHNGTPMAALSSLPLRLYEGQALMARANGLTQQGKMDLFYEGIQYPLAWLERRLAGTAPDLSGFLAQCQAASDALAQIEAPLG